jgi:AcrR family transcriptional regulator
MPRRTPDSRFDDLVACATQVFIDQGFQRTQMADIASAMSVAKGTLYLYVESKEALFDLVVRYASADPPYQPRPTFPVRTPRSGATLRYVRAELARHQAPPTLMAALARRRPTDATTELTAIARELYDLLATNRRGIKLIDRSARDYPELAALWFEGSRRGVVQLLARYLEDRIRRGLVRPLPDTAIAARLILETTVFWAVHRHWDWKPEPTDEALARETVVTFVVQALGKD